MLKKTNAILAFLHFVLGAITLLLFIEFCNPDYYIQGSWLHWSLLGFAGFNIWHCARQWTWANEVDDD